MSPLLLAILLANYHPAIKTNETGEIVSTLTEAP